MATLNNDRVSSSGLLLFAKGLWTIIKGTFAKKDHTHAYDDITTVVADEDHKNASNVAGTTRYRYGGVDASGKPVWAFEYVINNTGLSQAQLLAVNSGISATKVGNYDSHLADTTKHITAAERTAWNGKQNALAQGTNITISGNTISATDTTYAYVTPDVIVEILNAMQVSD